MSYVVDGKIVNTAATVNAKGGTELMRSRLLDVVDHEEMKVYMYVYKIECPISGNYYIGQRTYRGYDVKNDTYMGSGKWIKILKTHYKTRYRKLQKSILEFCDTKNSLRLCEQKYINLCYNDPKCKNMAKDAVYSCDYKNNIKFDKTLYRFVNFNRMKIAISTQYDMAIIHKMPKSSVSSLIKGKSSYIKGWVYLGVWGDKNISLQEAFTKYNTSGKKGSNNVKYNHMIYTWYNPDTDMVLESTCHDMKKHTSSKLNFGKAINNKNIYKSVGGYYIVSNGNFDVIKNENERLKHKSGDNPNSDKKVYEFIKNDNIFIGNKYEFIAHINDDSKYSFKYVGDLIKRRQKTYKGWQIK